MLPIFPAEGSATVHIVGVGVSDLTGRIITGPCEGTLKFKYRFTEGWNGVSMEVHSQFTEGPTLVGPDGRPVAVPAPKPGSGTLVMEPDVSCDLRVDGVFTHTVAPFGSFMVEAMPGERLITCDSITVAGVRASEERKVEAGAKVVVALSLEAPEKASLAAAKRVPEGKDVKPARSPDAMIDSGDGVLEQVSSGLLWTQRDNASDLTWDGAHRYCDALRTSGGGWRLPSEPEFRSLYIDTAGVAKAIPCGDHTCAASPFHLSNWWFWTSEHSDSRTAWIFTLSDDYGRTSSYPVGASSGSRALCVHTPRAEQADTAQARARVASEAASRRPVVAGKEIDRGGGVLEQVSSGLLWTQRDNGADISWDSARRYCEKLSISGGRWRLPSERDLRNLFLDAVGTKAVACGVGFCGVPLRVFVYVLSDMGGGSRWLRQRQVREFRAGNVRHRSFRLFLPLAGTVRPESLSAVLDRKKKPIGFSGHQERHFERQKCGSHLDQPDVGNLAGLRHFSAGSLSRADHRAAV